MPSFSLQSQRTGAVHTFSILDLLYQIGDPVNDEIRLDSVEEVFRLSSFTELRSDGSTVAEPAIRWIAEPIPVQAGQQQFSLQQTPSGPVLLLMLNGLVQQAGADYQQRANQLILTYKLHAGDQLQCIYQTHS